MAVIFDESDINILDEMGNQLLDELGNTPPVAPVKNPTSWIPQSGYGYVSSFTGVSLTTDLNATLTTQLGIALTTTGNKITGKNPVIWRETGA